MRKILERYVWSPTCGGCLMLEKRLPNGKWEPWSSIEEDQYPTNDNRAKEAVRRMNAHIRANDAMMKVRDLEAKATLYRQKAYNALVRAGWSKESALQSVAARPY